MLHTSDLVAAQLGQYALRRLANLRPLGKLLAVALHNEGGRHADENDQKLSGSPLDPSNLSVSWLALSQTWPLVKGPLLQHAQHGVHIMLPHP
jgi:hypothetical protein